MNLFSKKDFALYAGKSAAAVSKALRTGRLETYKDTNEINANTQKSQAFKATIGQGQKNIIPSATNGSVEQPDEDLVKAGEKVLLATEKKTIEEAEYKKQQRIEKEMKNAVRRGELLEEKLVNESIMTFFDRWLNSNKRGWLAFFDDFMRHAFQIFENETSDTDHKMTRPELRQKAMNTLESWAHEGKEESVKRVKLIQIEQGKK